MIPILYGAAETAFTSNGLGRLVDAKRCEVMEVKNGEYELELDYPLTGAKFDKLQLGMIISSIHDDRGDRQPFVIYQRTAPLDGIVTFNARHISYELGTVVAVPFSASSAVQALAGLKSNSVNTNRFNFSTDITTLAPFALTEPTAVRGAMGGVEGSILDVYGGEYKFNNFDVQLLAHRGQNTGVTIRYGKNLTDLRHITDGSEAYNAVVPFWAEENEETGNVMVMLPERIVTAAGVTDPVAVPLDLSQDFEEQPTEAQLRAAAQQHLADLQPWEPDVNLTLDFINLADTLEYEDVLNLQRLSLCDTIDVVYTALGVTAENIQIIKTTYDVLAERYIKMELGTARSTYAQVIEAQTDAKIKQSEKTTEGFFTAAIAAATDLLKGVDGGNIRIVTYPDGSPKELLILDTDDLDTATNILRINLNGIGFSTDGGETYATAWTIAGQFVADFITAGTLKAIKIEGPTSLTFWDLATGIFQSYGVRTLSATVTASGGAQTVITYDTQEKTKIDAGVITVTGKKSTDADNAETVFSDLGVRAADGVRKWYAAGLPSDLSNETYAYPHGGIVSRGYRVTAYGGAGDISRESRVTAEYNPRSILTPDLLKLGEAENPTYSSGSNNTPDRNVLQLNGGWVNKEDSILFYPHAKTYMYYDPDEQDWYSRLRFSRNPDPSRVAWDLAPGDTEEHIFAYCMGLLTSSKKVIVFQLPLVRPLSPHAQFIHLDGTIRARQGSTVLCNDDLFDSYEDAGSHYFTAITPTVAGLALELHHWGTGTWSTGTLYAPVFITLKDTTLSILYDNENPDDPT